MLIEFPSVVSAVACAVEIQSAMRTRNATEPAARIEFRIGVNLGDIIVEDGDIFGDGVNVAARLESIAPIGGIAVSQSVRDHVGKRLDLAFEDMGERRLKNIEAPIRVYSISVEHHLHRWRSIGRAGTAVHSCSAIRQHERRPGTGILQ